MPSRAPTRSAGVSDGGGGALALAPLLPATLPAGIAGTAAAVPALVGLGLLSTAFACLLYFQLIRSVGPARALTVAFLIPLFGALWSAALLGEPFIVPMGAGGVLVVAGTALVVGGGSAR